MEEPGVGAIPAAVPLPPVAPSGPAQPEAAPEPAPTARRRSLTTDLILLGIVGVVLVGAIAAGVGALYREFYSPAAFVERYLSLLSDGRAADALAVPGVAVDSAVLENAGLPATASEALLRSTALAPLTVLDVVEESDGDITHVTVSFVAGGHEGTTTFDVVSRGWIGVVPAWRFAHTPLAVVDLTVDGSMRFSVNGFEVDKRQVSAAGADAAATDAVPLLVFSPGLYRISVDTAISKTAGVDVIADKPLANVPVSIQAQPTEEFIGVVQKRVDEFLADCATQEVLQPTACPFGYVVTDRIDGLPKWSIVDNPTVTVTPDGAQWQIPSAKAVAHIEVDVVSLYDGSVRHVDRDVSFLVNGDITILPDGTASIRIASE